MSIVYARSKPRAYNATFTFEFVSPNYRFYRSLSLSSLIGCCVNT